jgi:hypothetical protein
LHRIARGDGFAVAEDKHLISLRVAQDLLRDIDRWRGQQANP